jgi:hypothetical protein
MFYVRLNFITVPSLHRKRDGQLVMENAWEVSRNGTVMLLRYSVGNTD